MHYVTANEMRSHLGELLSRIERGERIVVTRSGRDVAMMIPMTSGSAGSPFRALRKRLQAEGRLVSMEEALKWREEDRP